jgi:hypothetical protein
MEAREKKAEYEKGDFSLPVHALHRNPDRVRAGNHGIVASL